MRYVDGFVIPIPKKNLKAYLSMARLGKRIWLKHGALDYQECVSDDVRSPFGLPFPKGIRARKGEAVLFSYIVFRSKAHRNAVNAKVMRDPAMSASLPRMPFDAKRMIYGGFRVLVGR